MNKYFTLILIIVGLFFSSAIARYDEPLNHVGLSRIYDKKVQKKFASRFNASGEPLFLVGNIKRGIAIGDMIRFDDKVMLIDAEVWQTMKATGVLKLLKNAPVIQVKAKARSNTWAAREDQAIGIERKAYTLGAAFLSTMEDRFKYTPTALELILRFEGANMVLMAPEELLKKLIFKTSSAPKRKKKGSPEIVTLNKEIAFKGQKFEHQVWAVDVDNPGREIKYSLKSKLPKGLSWSSGKHTISGKPKKAGVYKLKLEAKNKFGRIDKQSFYLTIKNNEDPKIIGNPESIVAKGSVWEYTPVITDPDHLLNSLKVKAIDVPKGIKFNKETFRFTLKSGLSKAQMKELEKKCFSVRAKDPIGGSAEREICFDESASLSFRSALSSNKLQVGQAAYYKPVAVGPSQRVKYKMYDMNNDLVDKDKKHFKLNTDLAGSYGLVFEAEDDQGNKATQLVSYKVLGTKSNWHGGGLTVQHLANNVTAEHLYYRNGSSRIGFYFPNSTENVPNLIKGIGKNISLMDIPFLIAGLNATGEAQEAEGNTLFVEGGMKLWADDGVMFGGYFLRIDGQYNAYHNSDLVVEYKVQYFANQAIVNYDSENVKKFKFGRDSVNTKIEQMVNNSGPGGTTIPEYLDSIAEYHPGIGEAFDNYANENNDVLLIEFQTWFKMLNAVNGNVSVWAAPIYWYEDHVYSSDISEHNIALGGKGIFNIPGFIADAHVRLGLTVSNNGEVAPAIRGGLNLYFGRVSH
ncbi:MAG: Ig domain-containing protein [Fibrobacterales bacterium]